MTDRQTTYHDNSLTLQWNCTVRLKMKGIASYWLPKQRSAFVSFANRLVLILITAIQHYQRSRQIIQEAPLTLRGQRRRCRNIEGDLQSFGSFPSPRLRLLFLWVWFLVGLGKPKLCNKAEVASFSHCVNIEGNPQILGSTPSAGPCPPFLLRVVLSWALANSRCVPNLKSLAPAVAEIL